MAGTKGWLCALPWQLSPVVAVLRTRQRLQLAIQPCMAFFLAGMRGSRAQQMCRALILPCLAGEDCGGSTCNLCSSLLSTELSFDRLLQSAQSRGSCLLALLPDWLATMQLHIHC